MRSASPKAASHRSARQQTGANWSPIIRGWRQRWVWRTRKPIKWSLSSFWDEFDLLEKTHRGISLTVLSTTCHTPRWWRSSYLWHHKRANSEPRCHATRYMNNLEYLNIWWFDLTGDEANRFAFLFADWDYGKTVWLVTSGHVCILLMSCGAIDLAVSCWCNDKHETSLIVHHRLRCMKPHRGSVIHLKRNQNIETLVSER